MQINSSTGRILSYKQRPEAKRRLLMTTSVSRHLMASFLNRFLATDYIGDYGYSDIPFYAAPGTNGILENHKVRAPVRTSVVYAETTRRGDNHVLPAGDILRWLDSVPRDTVLVWPDYSGSFPEGEWRYYKDRKGQWSKIGYTNWRESR